MGSRSCPATAPNLPRAPASPPATNIHSRRRTGRAVSKHGVDWPERGYRTRSSPRGSSMGGVTDTPREPGRRVRSIRGEGRWRVSSSGNSFGGKFTLSCVGGGRVPRFRIKGRDLISARIPTSAKLAPFCFVTTAGPAKCFTARKARRPVVATRRYRHLNRTAARRF